MAILISNAALGITPVFEGKDKSRSKIPIVLTKVSEGYSQPTDIQFVPSHDLMLIAEKEGKLNWESLKTKQKGTFLKLDVLTSSEQGLLGVALHPKFPPTPKIYTYYSTRHRSQKVSRISEWMLDLTKKDLKKVKARNERVLLEVDQPYGNHNAGQLQFGPDGFLYIGFGDGGAGDDPHGNGQNPKTYLGTMIRIDIDKRENGKAYAIPKDNPFAENKDFLPEIWAWGLRNPWRFSFTDDGKLISGDVGQNLWEEVTVVGKGQNHGWNVFEATHCFNKNKECGSKEKFTMPIAEYDREDGWSITGGYTAKIPKSLEGKYIFGDYVKGTLWALNLEDKKNSKGLLPLIALGKFSMLISTFGRDRDGRIYVADFGGGKIYRVDAPN